MRVIAVALVVAVAGACVHSPVAPPPRPADIDVVELSATEAARRMTAGELTSRALTQAYLDRIAQIDNAGPTLNAVIEIDPSALEAADARDAERTAGKVRGPLHGIPILVKDNIDVAGMINSAGSLALAEHRPRGDAFLVTRLRHAGAVILGKTNLSEWANFRSTRSTSGWSSRGGQTKNPYVLDRNPCGSSSGTGSAVAASLAAIGVGTETDGSIICPSAVSALVGLKPTVGLVSRRGIIPISISQDTAGPMGRTVGDVAMLLTAIAGVDDEDPSGPSARGHIADDYSAFLKADAVRGKRFGVLRQAMGFHPDTDAAVSKAIDILKSHGATVVDVKMAGYGSWEDPELEALLYEFKDGLNQYLRLSGSPQASLEAVIAFNKAHARTVMPYFGQELFERAQNTGPLTDAAYKRARDTATRLAGKEGILAALDKDKLDALVAPSVSPAWPTDHVLGDRFLGAGYGAAAVAGTPSITIPIADSYGLPIGFTIMGRPYSEPDLLAFAFVVEQAAKARKAPQYKKTLE